MKTTLSLLFAALVFAGCTTTSRVPAVALGPPEKTVVLTAKDRGRMVSLLPNGTITVDLNANGGQWRLASRLDPAILEMTAGEAVKLPPVALPPVGAALPQPHQLVFKSVGPGTTRVRLVYSRPNQPLTESVYYDFTVNAE
jgi:hypothetical protein